MISLRRKIKKWSVSKQGEHHELTNLLNFIDDFGGIFSSWRAAEFTWVHWLILTFDMGAILANKAGKTNPSSIDDMPYLGFELVNKLMLIRLIDSRVKDMHNKLSDILSQGSITIKDLFTVVGVLVFATAVIPCARLAYLGLLDVLKNLGLEAK